MYAGASPLDELTPRELAQLAKTRQTMEWDHTAALMATATNMMAKKGQARKPMDFNPYRAKGGPRRRGGLSLEQFADKVKGLKNG